jgi:hydrogenase maturation protein HypF
MPNLSKASLHVTGIVQGVGFRPFVYGLAIRCHLQGWVRNSSAGVDIEVDGTSETLRIFIEALKTELPPLARIDSLDITYSTPGYFKTFEIIGSETVPGAFQPIPPDVCICEDCLREMLDPTDRRYRYPFINCTNCGPRFTIISDIPYDRPNTTMAHFKMCPDCEAEYNDPLDRRFHAQPIACPVCGPKVWLENGVQQETDQARVEGEDAIQAARLLLAQGKILAVKGLGGFHLACDATNIMAVSELRRRKLRVDKPFALMMPDLETVGRYCIFNDKERELLESRQRPIAILQRKPDSGIADEIAPGQNKLGVMLPYTPLHYLLFTGNNNPFTTLVMTSGNMSEEPIATENKEAHERLTALADAFLMHDRDIQTRCDDSVVEEFGNNNYFLRRSRGFAPDSIQLPFEGPSILATGPELKNTFCLTREGYAFLSHHIGDLENYETLQSFTQGIEQFERLFRIKPEAIGYDLHPNYMATKYAVERAKRLHLPAVGVQHHHAHIASCMADNGLKGDYPVIGVAFDGTGYGDDGAIWGGEFLVTDNTKYQRLYHMEYFPLPGGDAAIKRPARTALALLWSLGVEWEESLLPYKSMDREELNAIQIQLKRNLNTINTSSLGRLFDAVAAIVGVRQNVNYEAQAAIEFEALADPDETGRYRFEIKKETVDVKPMIASLLEDIKQSVPKPILSARFHNGVADMVEEVCGRMRKDTGVRDVALSGGVWQNTTLMKRTVNGLRRDGFRVYIHNQVPTNDGGIALGQALVTLSRVKKGLPTQ